MVASALVSAKVPLAQSVRSSRVSRRTCAITVRAAQADNTQNAQKTSAAVAVASLLAAQGADAAEIASIAAGDSRAGLLFLPLTAALGWVGFNIAGPALNQLNNMGSGKKSFAAGLGLAAASLLAAQGADAAEIASIAAGDSRAGLLFLPLTAALGWVGFNIAGPALNQLNNMGKDKKSFAAGLGLAAASLLAAQSADAAEIASIAAGDSRAGLLFLPLTAALGWVGFNIAGPALNQLNNMGSGKKSFAAGLGLAAASLLAAQGADAAEIASIAAGDSRAGLLFLPLTAALGWVGFNIAGPALNQLNNMSK